MVPRAGVEPARPFSGKRRILSPQCLPISPSGRRLPHAYLRESVTRAAHARNALPHLVTELPAQPLALRRQEKREAEASLTNMEREKSLELSTSTLARLRSTN